MCAVIWFVGSAIINFFMIQNPSISALTDFHTIFTLLGLALFAWGMGQLAMWMWRRWPLPKADSSQETIKTYMGATMDAQRLVAAAFAAALVGTLFGYLAFKMSDTWGVTFLEWLANSNFSGPANAAVFAAVGAAVVLGLIYALTPRSR